jgi:alpha-tubulin suppressor-like RCC1 family protein
VVERNRWARSRIAAVVGLVVLAAAPAFVVPSTAAWSAGGVVRSRVRSQQAIDLFPDEVGAGDGFSIIETTAGVLYGVGANDVGQLGDGTTTARVVASPVDLPDSTEISGFDVGIDHVVLRDAAGGVWTWGNATQAGGFTTTPRSVDLPTSSSAVDVEAGGYFSLVVTLDGAVYAWGNNGGGRLGRSDLGENNDLCDGTFCAAGRVDAVGETFVAVGAAAARSSGAAWDASGDVRVWGTSAWGGSSGVSVAFDPSETDAPSGVEDAAFVGESLFVLDAAGRVWRVEGTDSSRTARIVPELSGVAVRTMVVSFSSTSLEDPSAGAGVFFVTTGGQLFASGSNANGRLGLDPAVAFYSDPTPVPVAEPPVVLAAGDNHTVFTTASGRFFAAGSNDRGQFGIGRTDPDPTESFIEFRLHFWFPEEHA